MKKTIIFLFVVFSTLSVAYAFNVSAKSAILYEPKTKTVLYEKDILTKREIASTTKIMTAVIVLENTNPDEIVTIPESCTNIEGTSLYLKKGEKLSVSDLLYGMMLKSGNDAATALADYVGKGSVKVFVDMMNEKAKELGMFSTNFENPSGLPSENHVSTANDMAKLAAYAMENETFLQIVSTKQKSLPGRMVTNHNKLLSFYDGANGIKTGFTKAAGRCLVSSAKRDEMNLIAVTLSAPDDWDDHMALFDYGFDNYNICSEDRFEEVATLPVVGGEESYVQVSLAGDVGFLYKEKELFEREIHLPRHIYAPICSGDEVGKIIYKVNGKTVETATLVSDDSVLYKEKENILKSFLNFLMKA